MFKQSLLLRSYLQSTPGMSEIAIREKINGTGWDGTGRDWTVTVLGLKIPLITAHERWTGFINTIPNERER